MVHNAQLREKLGEIQARGKVEKERWDKERESIRSQFLKELDDDAANAEAAKVAAAKGEKTGSDEDAVIVDGGGLATPGSATEKGVKKRKSKK